MLEKSIRCPVCDATRFRSYRGRKNAQCARCGSKERHRLLALVLGHLECGPAAEYPICHFAPERAISDLLAAKFGPMYRAADFAPEIYSGIRRPVEKVDLTQSREHFSANSVAGFIHSHVLEHLPVHLGPVIAGMNGALRPGGVHIFQIPVVPGQTDEDLSPLLTDDDRLKRFGQEDTCACLEPPTSEKPCWTISREWSALTSAIC